jgi:hypothetical protein
MNPKFIYVAPFEFVGLAEIAGMEIVRDPSICPTNVYITEVRYEELNPS